MQSLEKSHVIQFTIFTFLTLFFSTFFFQKINLTTADLGRHIKNGEVFIKQHKIINTNYYSYTQPDFPTVNHHWFTGVVFYIVESIVGFTGLSLFYALISGFTVTVFFIIAKRKSNFWVALLFTLLLLPLMITRREIRPEGFSYLFLGVFFLILEKYKSRELSFKLTAISLTVLQLFWVNLHLFFIMGIMLVGIYGAGNFLFYKKSQLKQYSILLGLTIGASLLNPEFISGLLEPLNIFKEYGYMLVENQSIFFMQKRAPGFNYFFIEIVALVFLILFVNILITKKFKKHFELMVIGIIYMVLAFKAIRGISMFGFVLTPFLADTAANSIKKYAKPLALLLLFIIVTPFFSFVKFGNGLGLLPGINNSSQFYKDNNLKGPIFNNYDIGGYLIYHLDEPVFMDNRPEAYSADFLQNTYIKAQEDEELWEKISEEYNLNTIYFYRHDATPWAQPFLIKRIQDDTWVPVFVDNYTIILVKQNEQNQDIISNYALPKNYFVVT